MDSDPASWQLPPGPVLRQLKRVAGDGVTAADFLPDEADQLREWTRAQQQHDQESGRHRGRGRLRRRKRGQHR